MGWACSGAVAHSQRQLEIDLEWIEEEIGDRPYGVDLIVPAKYAGSDDGEFTLDDVRALIPPEHIAFVDDILRRYDVPELPDDETGGGFGRRAGRRRRPRSRPRARRRISRSHWRTGAPSSSTRSGLHRRT